MYATGRLSVKLRDRLEQFVVVRYLGRRYLLDISDDAGFVDEKDRAFSVAALD